MAATSWTDPTITADDTKARQIHRQELCAAINADISARSGTPIVWTDTPGAGQVDVLLWRKPHVDELRAACSYDYGLIGTCGTNTMSPPSWTDPTVNADSTFVRKPHVDDLRTYINAMETTCHCDCDGHCSCNGHSDCSCNGHGDCGCNDC